VTLAKVVPLSSCVCLTLLMMSPGCGDVKAPASSASPPPSFQTTPIPKPTQIAIEPGSLLTEQDFVPALKATGAKFIVITVFMADCAPCITESLQLADRRAAWRSTGVEILGIGMSEKPVDARRFFKQTGERTNFPLYTARWFPEKEKIEATPALFIFTPDGERLFRFDGESGENLSELINAKLEELLTKAK